MSGCGGGGGATWRVVLLLANSISAHFLAVKLKSIKAGPRLHIVNLCHSTVSIYNRDNNIRIICVLAYLEEETPKIHRANPGEPWLAW